MVKSWRGEHNVRGTMTFGLIVRDEITARQSPPRTPVGGRPVSWCVDKDVINHVATTL